MAIEQENKVKALQEGYIGSAPGVSIIIYSFGILGLPGSYIIVCSARTEV